MNPQRVQGPHPADPQQQLLADPDPRVASVKPRRQRPVRLAVLGDVRIQKQAASSGRLPPSRPARAGRRWSSRPRPGAACRPARQRSRSAAARCRRSGKAPAASHWHPASGESTPGHTGGRLRQAGFPGRWRSSNGRRPARPGRPNRSAGSHAAQTRPKSRPTGRGRKTEARTEPQESVSCRYSASRRNA